MVSIDNMQMKDSLIYWLQRKIKNLVSVEPQNYRIILVKFFRLLGIPILAIFSISDLRRGAVLDGVTTIVPLLFFIFSLKIIEKSKNASVVYRIGLGLLTISFLISIYSDLDLTVSTLWLFLLPIPISFLLGATEGSVWITAIFILSLIAIFISPNHVPLPTQYVIRYGITYLILGVLSIIVESVRDAVHLLFIEKQGELLKLNQKFYESSIRDPLTNFYNRLFLADAFEKMISQAIRARIPVVFVLLDIDNFKVINDECGHLVGDEILVKISEAIRAPLKRKSDLVVRYGGDEFLVVLFDTTKENAKLLVTEIKQNFDEIQVLDCKGRISASFGLAELHKDELPFRGTTAQLIDKLISMADHNMYTAKSLGGNSVIG